MNLPRDRSLAFRGSKALPSNDVRSSENMISTLVCKRLLASLQSQRRYCVQKRNTMLRRWQGPVPSILWDHTKVQRSCSMAVAVARNGSLSLHIIAPGQASMAKSSMQFVSIYWNSRSYRCQKSDEYPTLETHLEGACRPSAVRGAQGLPEPKQQSR
jgi:hypothetical protein